MFIIRLLFRLILYVLSFLVTFIVVYLILAFTLPYIGVNKDFKETENGISIFIKSNGVHTDVIVPANSEFKNWKKDFPARDFAKVDTSFAYLAFGWGDKGFYLETPTWDDLKFSTAFKAAFFLSSTAMHVTYYPKAPDEDDLCKKIVISEEQYHKLISYIQSSFQQNDKNFILINHPGYGKTDKFYEAEGTYSFIKTCNCWTGSALKESGIRTCFWSPFHSGILSSVKVAE